MQHDDCEVGGWRACPVVTSCGDTAARIEQTYQVAGCPDRPVLDSPPPYLTGHGTARVVMSTRRQRIPERLLRSGAAAVNSHVDEDDVV